MINWKMWAFLCFFNMVIEKFWMTHRNFLMTTDFFFFVLKTSVLQGYGSLIEINWVKLEKL